MPGEGGGWEGTVRGMPIAFPFEPYGVQLAFMDGALCALENAEHAVLESPTGTGKTLCLLASTLAWARCVGVSPPSTGWTWFGRRRQPDEPVVVYASRTHAQLSQAIRALRGTTYADVRTATIGSREQLCGHGHVSKLRGAVQNRACQELCARKGCHLRNALDRRIKAEANSKVAVEGRPDDGPLDIEELASVLKSRGECAYFASRYAMNDAKIVFAPYNYVLDPAQRASTRIGWANAVVVVDEAHNVASVAEDAASFDVTSADIGGAIDEVALCLRAVATSELRRAATGGLDAAGTLDDLPTEDLLLRLKRVLLRLEETIDAVPLVQSPKGATFHAPGGFFHRDLLRKAGVDASNADWLLQGLRSAADVLLSTATTQRAARNLELLEKVARVAFRKAATTTAFQQTTSLGNAFAADAAAQADESYRVHIRETEDGGRQLGFWCFSAGLAIAELRALGARSVLFASGTLSPVGSYAAELGLGPRTVFLENPHVIDASKQLFAAVARVGPTSAALRSTYANRNSDEYRDELGRTLDRVFRAVPRGGVLVFFASYAALTATVRHWQQARGGAAWRALQAGLRGGTIAVEPQNDAAAMAACSKAYDDAISHYGSAALFAVCRGKVSEGMDFTDDRCRCVVLTGIPYAAALDPKVTLKRTFLDDRRAAERMQIKARGLKEDPRGLSGEEWYAQQACRAVNQALGRVIRHRRDFGAVILCDERFADGRQRNEISKWVRDALVVPPDFATLDRSLRTFFGHGHKPTPAAASAYRRRPPAPSSTRVVAAPAFGCELESLLDAAGKEPKRQIYATLEDAMLTTRDDADFGTTAADPQLGVHHPSKKPVVKAAVRLSPAVGLAAKLPLAPAQPRRPLNSFVLSESSSLSSKRPRQPAGDDAWPTFPTTTTTTTTVGSSGRSSSTATANGDWPAPQPRAADDRPAKVAIPRGRASSSSSSSAPSTAAPRPPRPPVPTAKKNMPPARAGGVTRVSQEAAAAKGTAAPVGSKRARMLLQYQSK